MVRVTTKLDSDDATDELMRLARGFDGELIARFDGALERIFQRSQATVHVVSGALRSSGRRKTRSTAERWRGTITYGGPSTVPEKNPVKYAYIEQARPGRRSEPPFDSHDYLRFVSSDWKAFLDATTEWLIGRNSQRRKAKFKKTGAQRRRKGRR